MAILAGLSPGAAAAMDAKEPCPLSAPERHRVVEVKDGETLALADGTIVRLIGAKAPAAPLNYRGKDPWPLVAEAKAALSELARGAEIELRFGGARSDRHGRLLAQAFVVRGEQRLWLQGELVGRGLARVYSFPDNQACVAELLRLEDAARMARAGVWDVSAYGIVQAGNVERLSRLTRSYQLVEGDVVAVGEGSTRLYLNFAEDWRRDFTVAVTRKDVDAFKAEGLDLKALAGKRLRVRGWVEWRNGPMIEATHPGQIELLPGRAPASSEGNATPHGDVAL